MGHGWACMVVVGHRWVCMVEVEVGHGWACMVVGHRWVCMVEAEVEVGRGWVCKAVGEVEVRVQLTCTLVRVGRPNGVGMWLGRIQSTRRSCEEGEQLWGTAIIKTNKINECPSARLSWFRL